jgi:hypothetical protein
MVSQNSFPYSRYEVSLGPSPSAPVCSPARPKGVESWTEANSAIASVRVGTYCLPPHSGVSTYEPSSLPPPPSASHRVSCLHSADSIVNINYERSNRR